MQIKSLRSIFIISILCLSLDGFSQVNADKKQIHDVLDLQARAWSQGDLESYMAGYWKSDSLRFIGKSGMTLGWESTLRRYKKSYPSKEAMGILRFDLLYEYAMGKNNYLTVGKWHLTRENMKSLDGHFTLIWEKKDGKWVVVMDHSS